VADLLLDEQRVVAGLDEVGDVGVAQAVQVQALGEAEPDATRLSTTPIISVMLTSAAHGPLRLGAACPVSVELRQSHRARGIWLLVSRKLRHLCDAVSAATENHWPLHVGSQSCSANWRSALRRD
jgi:hypothetical protein